MRKRFLFFSAVIILFAAMAMLLPAEDSRSELRDGYYTAEVSEYYHGWKEFLTIYVNNGKIVMAEFDARNSTGFIKSWDMDYMRMMNRTDGNYPNQYTRNYTSQLVAGQRPGGVDAMSGATESHKSFIMLAEAAMRQARAGDGMVAFVDVSHEADD
jgi:major membrane immunogen (membrane-anchored lipoprotein)